MKQGQWKVRALALALLITLSVAGTVFILSQRADDPLAANAVQSPPFTSLTYSIQVFAWWDTAINAGLQMDWTRLMGFTHIKQTFAWQNIQPEPDDWMFNVSDEVVALANARDLDIVARLGEVPEWALAQPDASKTVVDGPPADMETWRTYCGRIASRYAGRIKAYQVWNEPNLSREWGGSTPDAAAYAELLRHCSEAIHAADRDAIVISAGLAPTGTHNNLAHRDDLYLQAMYDAGFQEHADVVGMNAPGWGLPPSYSPDRAESEGRGRWATFRRVEDLRKIMVENGDAASQVAILEVGYTTDSVHPEYQWHAVSEDKQREYLVDAYQYAAENWRPWVGLMSAIYLAKPSWTQEDEQFWWALNNPQTGRMRPAFAGLAQMPKYCGDAVLPARSEEESAYAPEHNPCD